MEAFAGQVGTAGLFAVFLCLDEPVANQYHPGGTGTEPDTDVNAHEHPRGEKRERNTGGERQRRRVHTSTNGQR